MDEYIRIRNIIDSYLEKEDVLFTEEEMSLYDLCEMFKKRCSNLKELNDKNNFLKKKVDLKMKFHPLRLVGKCTEVYSYCNEHNSEISFSFKFKTTNIGYFLEVKRNINSSEIYFGDTTNSALVDMLYEDIVEQLDLIEDYYNLFEEPVGILNTRTYNEEIKDEIFNIRLLYGTDGRIVTVIKLKDEYDKQGILEVEWLNRERLSEYLKNNKDKLSKKIPVKISDLRPVFKNMVSEAMSLNIPQKQKVKIGGK